MKTQIIFLVLILSTFIFSCNSTNNSTSKNAQQERADDNVVTNEMATKDYEQENTKTDGNIGDIQGSNGSTGANMNINTGATTESVNLSVRYPELYSELNMTKEQIQVFETGMSKLQHTKSTTASGEIMGSLESERDRQLESILTPEQWSQYKDSKQKNN